MKTLVFNSENILYYLSVIDANGCYAQFRTNHSMNLSRTRFVINQALVSP
jgi:hypothetical protein